MNAISSARLRPMTRAWPPAGCGRTSRLPPGRAKAASVDATARSQEHTSWHPAAVARACTCATTGWGMAWMVVISSVHTCSSSPDLHEVGARHVGEVVPRAEDRSLGGEDHGPGVGVAHRPERLEQLDEVVERQRVASLGPAHGDGGDRLVAGDADRLVGHDRNLRQGVGPQS